MSTSGTRERTGRIGTLPIRLADLPRPYRHIYADTVEARRDVAGTDARAEAQRTTVREWKLDDWTGGFGNATWRPEQGNVYNIARNMMPEYRSTSYSGLTLGPNVSTAADDSPATFSPAVAGDLFYGRDVAETALTVYGIKNQALHPWLPSTSRFDATAVTAGAAGTNIDGVADPEDGYLYVLDDIGDVYKVDPGGATNTLHADLSAMSSPKWGSAGNTAILAYRGEVYLLGGQGDMHRLDRSTTNTSTRVVDAFYTTPVVAADFTDRITTSDVGPVWFHPTISGVDVWEYNVAEDSSSIIYRIDEPVYPWGIAFYGGFVFIGYSTSLNSESPNVYLRYFRGGQEGTLGPFIDTAESYAVTFGGNYQGRFIIVKASEENSPNDPFELFAYDLGAGARHHLATGINGTSTHAKAPGPPRLLGKQLLVPSSSGASTYRVELVDLEAYSTASAGDAYLDTGRYDFDLPGTLKLLSDVTVNLDALPANTSVQIQYSLDGGAWQNNGIDITVDGTTSQTFNMASQNDTFYELELRIMLNSTTSSAAPVIRSITARAIPVSVQEYWDIKVSLNPANYDTGFGADYVHPEDIAEQLATLKTTKQTVTFTNPWEVDQDSNDAAQTATVIVQTVDLPDTGGDESMRYAGVRLMKASLS